MQEKTETKEVKTFKIKSKTTIEAVYKCKRILEGSYVLSLSTLTAMLWFKTPYLIFYYVMGVMCLSSIVYADKMMEKLFDFAISNEVVE